MSASLLLTARQLALAERRYRQRRRRIARRAVPDAAFLAVPQAERVASARASYASFVQRYFPHYATHPLAAFHTAAAEALRANPEHHAVWKWFRGAAKSTHANLLVPLWLLVQDPPELAHLLLVGRSQAHAVRLLADVHAELAHNARLRLDFGLVPQRGHWARGAFAVVGQPQADGRRHPGAAFHACGMGQSPRGLRHGARRPDYVVADDLDHALLSRNPERVRALAAWLLEDVLGTMDVGRGRFLLVGNHFAQHSIVGSLEATGRFAVHRVDALDAEGRPTWPEKYGPDGAWLHRRRALIGYRAFAREYQNTPLVEGAVFRPEWIRWVETPHPAAYDALVLYIDPAFTSGRSADYKAVKVWGLRWDTGGGMAQFHQLRAFVRQCGADKLARWCYDTYAALTQPDAAGNAAAPVCYVEANLLQHTLLQPAFDAEALRRGWHLPLRPDPRAKPPKAARIEAMAYLWERGAVAYCASQRTDPDTATGMDQLLAFGPGSRAHDDAPDADEGALFLLQQQHRRHTATPPIIVARQPNPTRW